MHITGLYIYIDGSDLKAVAEPIESSMRKWLKETDLEVTIVNQQHERTPGLPQDDLTDWDLGINFGVEQLPNLKAITDFLYTLASKYDRDFVLGYYDEATNLSEDISYFGAECGKPKVGEIKELLLSAKNNKTQ